MTIAFLGPDGSGKSTIIDKFFVEKTLFTDIKYFHLKPIKPKKEQNHIVVSEPHKFLPYSKIKSYIKLLYFVYQYNIGWLKNIYPINQKKALIIFDRYFDDILVDYRRYRYGGSLQVAKSIRFFIPKPDIYFILTTEANVIFERKKEVSYEELQRQIKAYDSLADGKRYFKIDVNRNPEDIMQEIVGIVTEKIDK